jgi:hypothetical protein
MMKAYVGDEPIETVRREWIAPEDVTERELASAALEALLVFCDGWIEPLVVEATVGCFDRERLHVPADATPPKPHWLVHADPLPPDVRLYHLYADPEIRSLPQIDRASLVVWLERILEQRCPGPAIMEPTLVDLVVPTCRVKLPPSFARSELLALDCYAGIIDVPVERKHGAAWIAGPRAGYAMHPPISVAVGNDNGALILDAKLYWSPWRGELERTGSDVAEAVQRFEQCNWSEAF